MRLLILCLIVMLLCGCVSGSAKTCSWADEVFPIYDHETDTMNTQRQVGKANEAWEMHCPINTTIEDWKNQEISHP
jgi:hypothetical protein